MASLLRSALRPRFSLTSPSSSTPNALLGIAGRVRSQSRSQTNPLFFFSPSRSMRSLAETRISAFHGHLLRLLRSEIEYESRSRPPVEAVVEFDGFAVEERPGEQCVRMRKRHGEKEDVRVDATMFDGFVPKASPGVEDDGTDEYGKLHISLVVEVSKGEGLGGVLQFLCSVWSDSLVVKNVSVLPPESVHLQAFNGQNFKELEEGMQVAVTDYLAERGIDDDLAVFLHDYMSNKDRFELLRWMKNVKSFIET